MARIYPFRAWRYNPSAVRLDDVVTLPYDKISPALQQAYYQRSPYNLVRIILGLPELFDTERGESVYKRAARDFQAWREQGILIQEKDPCVFAYSQQFAVPGSETVRERRGFIALGKLYDYDEQIVFRHEHTLSKPKADRLHLLRATRAHFGQIFMLYSDPAATLESILYDESVGPDAEVTDEYGAIHRVWRVSDPATIRLLTTAMADKKLIIADGHHRYETALGYMKERAPTDSSGSEHSTMQLPETDFPEEAVMMTFVNMDSEGLVILPTHRVVHSLSGFDAGSFTEAAQTYFSIANLPCAPAAEYLAVLAKQKGTAFVAVVAKGALLLTAKPEATSRALSDLPAQQRGLDLSCLHTIVLERILGLDVDRIAQETNIRYVRDASDAVEQVRRGEAEIAFLTKPVTIEQLREVAFAGSVMPQKSTDFYPKLLSGLTIYALE